ncbi:4-carboxymuconolactone decarboxylase [Panus rudis PR-1116 ss-1]|nr:4-carboxymuconolactone decarboxylase [Panus rudis PR-1116 ss-1]
MYTAVFKLGLVPVLLVLFLFATSMSSSVEARPMGARLGQKRDDNLPARVPYVFPEPGTDPVADTIRSRRTNNTLLDLDGVLLQDDNLANAWNGLADMIRDMNPIPADLRELFILRTAVLNNAAYQWLQHEPVARSVGFTTEQLREIRFEPAFLEPANPNSKLTEQQRAALLLADFMTKSIKVPQPVFDGLKKFMTDKQMVDAVATVGVYNLVSRFVVALNVDDKMDVPVPVPQ